MINRTLTAALILTTTTLGHAQQSTELDLDLTITDPAPKIDITHWVKGKQVEDFIEGQIYVVEFWATWCGPCIRSMPHLSDMQNEYREEGVTFISVSNEPLQTVIEFLCKSDEEGVLWFNKIDYTLTTDPDKSVHKEYFSAAGQRGIPCAFIVGKNKTIQWIGHPMSREEPLEAVIADEWNAAEFKTKFEDNLLQQKRAQTRGAALKKAEIKKDWETWLTLIDETIAESTGRQAWYYKNMKFEALLRDMNKPDQAYEVAQQLIEESWDEANGLNSIAWFIVEEGNVHTRDFDLAMKAAVQACELTDYENGMIIDTLARVYYETDDLDKAIEWQKKAVELEPDVEGISDVLERYEKAKQLRERN